MIVVNARHSMRLISFLFRLFSSLSVAIRKPMSFLSVCIFYLIFCQVLPLHLEDTSSLLDAELGLVLHRKITLAEHGLQKVDSRGRCYRLPNGALHYDFSRGVPNHYFHCFYRIGSLCTVTISALICSSGGPGASPKEQLEQVREEKVSTDQKRKCGSYTKMCRRFLLLRLRVDIAR